MKYYFAPLEGLTDSIYRKTHHQYFSGIDRYYMPFFSPTSHHSMTHKEIRELPPADTVDFTAIPQLLTRIPEDFLWAAKRCRDLGYTEVNLNLGCPSGTVTAKGKGSGMLRDLDALDSFFDTVFSQTPIPVSVKTRLGYDSAENFPRLLDILNQYPVHELILHPRLRSDFYKGKVDMDSFRYCLQVSKAPVCYNGDLCSLSQIEAFQKEYPACDAVMLGRGLIGDPGMLTPGGTTVPALESFMETLLLAYQEEFGSARNAMFRLKENWRHLICRFEGSKALGKQLLKANDINQYRSTVYAIFHTLPLAPTLQSDWLSV